MKKAEFQDFKDLLEVWRARLRGDVSQLTSEALGDLDNDRGGESKSPTHMAELGSETYEQDFTLSLVANEQETLAEVELALQRIRNGTFGLCESCVAEGKTPAQAQIPKERLKVIPYTRTCISCARKREAYT